MEPDVNPTPDVAPEQLEATPVKGPELAPEQSVEKPRFGPEQVSQPEKRTAAPVPAPPPLTVIADDDDDDDDQTKKVVRDQDIPEVAADVDLIEREWVNQAKAAIAKTKDDPYAQEVAFEKLQTEYLKRRRGDQMGMAA